MATVPGALAGHAPRRPAVAGRFYPASAAELEREVADLLGRAPAAAPRPAIGVLAPHAGYVYSGALAARVFAAVEIPPRVIVLGPNHTGRGRRVAVASRGQFDLPGGGLPIDAALADAVLAHVPGATADLTAHLGEHSIEVELPFLRARRPDVAIVPIVLGHLSERDAIAVGHGLARAIAAAGGDVLVVASSDLSHYLPDAEARAIDRLAIDAFLAGDPGGLYRTVERNDISMCGVIPATTMLAYARVRGGGAPELIGYATSGDALGDRSRVVGYAGAIVPPA